VDRIFPLICSLRNTVLSQPKVFINIESQMGGKKKKKDHCGQVVGLVFFLLFLLIQHFSTRGKGSFSFEMGFF